MFKEGPKSDRNNYRPISVLPIVSKIIEKIIFNQLYNYLTECNLLADSQHGHHLNETSEFIPAERKASWSQQVSERSHGRRRTDYTNFASSYFIMQ